MDSKRLIFEQLKNNPGTRYSPELLAGEINEGILIDINANPQEVQKYCMELAEENAEVKHYTTTKAEAVHIEGDRWTLYLDPEYLLYDIVAEYAPDRVEELEDLPAEQIQDWIRDELVRDSEGSVTLHEFAFEND